MSIHILFNSFFVFFLLQIDVFFPPPTNTHTLSLYAHPEKTYGLDSKTYSEWDYLLPGMRYLKNVHKIGRCSQPEETPTMKTSAKVLRLAFAKVLHYPLLPQIQNDTELIPGMKL